MFRRLLLAVTMLLGCSCFAGCACSTYYRYAGASDPKPYYRVDICTIPFMGPTIRVKCSSAQQLPNEECK